MSQGSAFSCRNSRPQAAAVSMSSRLEVRRRRPYTNCPSIWRNSSTACRTTQSTELLTSNLRRRSIIGHIAANCLTNPLSCAHASCIPVYSVNLHRPRWDKNLPGGGGETAPSSSLFSTVSVLAQTDMSDISLTPNVCARLGDPTDYRVLVSRPVVKVTEIEELVGREIGGFVALYRAILKDGDDISFQVVFPRDSDIGPPVEGSPISEGALIKIDQMVRIPNGSESIIVVYSADIVTEGFELKLTDMDQKLREFAARLRSETELRQQAEARLQALLPTNLEGLSQTLVDQIFEALIQVFEVTTQAII